MQLKQALRSSIFLKATSLIIGFLFWTIVGDSFHSHVWLKVPVTFYNNSLKKIEAPETIYIQLKGKRAHLRYLQSETLALHLDASNLTPGLNAITITAEHFFLPMTLTLNEAIPSRLVIIAQKDEVS